MIPRFLRRAVRAGERLGRDDLPVTALCKRHRGYESDGMQDRIHGKVTSGTGRFYPADSPGPVAGVPRTADGGPDRFLAYGSSRFLERPKTPLGLQKVGARRRPSRRGMGAPSGIGEERSDTNLDIFTPMLHAVREVQAASPECSAQRTVAISWLPSSAF